MLPGYTGTLVRDGYLAKQAVAEAKADGRQALAPDRYRFLRAAYAGAVAAGLAANPAPPDSGS